MRWTRPSEWPWGRWRGAVSRVARSPEPAEREPEPSAQGPEQPPEEDDNFLKRASDTAWRLILIGAVAALILWALTYISTVVIPVVLAMFLTALLQPMANWLRAQGLGRGTSTLITFLGSLAVLGLVIYFIVDRVIVGVPELVGRVSQFLAGTPRLLRDLGLDADLITDFVTDAQEEIQDWLQESLQGNVENIVNGVWTSTVAVGQVLFGIVLLLVMTIYFLHSGDKLMDWIGSLLPRHTRRVMRSSGELAYDVMGRYVRGVALVGLFDAIGIGLLLLVLAMPQLDLLSMNLALPLIVLTFIGAFLPVVGAFVTGALATIVVLVTSGELWIGVVTLVWVVIIQQLESNVFAPRVYGRSLELPSPVVLLGISVGAIIAGVVGMFLATPVIAVVAALLRNQSAAQEEHKEPEQQSKDAAGDREPRRGVSGEEPVPPSPAPGAGDGQPASEGQPRVG